jgi:hypothetical protein
VIVRYIDTSGLPRISNVGSQNRTDCSADMVGTLITNGASAATISLYWSTNDCTTNASAWTATGFVTNLGSKADGQTFTNTIAGLASNTVYYWNHSAVNSSGTTWAADAGSPSFKSLGPPVVNNGIGATAVHLTNATLNGNLTAGTSAHGYFYWWTNGAPTTNSTDLGTVVEGGFSTNVSGLALDTLHYYRSYATNAYGEAWSPVTNFLPTAVSTWYVAPSPAGNDTNTGYWWGNPFSTIGKGIAAASSGDTVLVSNGLYSTAAQLTISNGITVRSLNGPGVTTIKGNSTFRILYITKATNVVIDGFTMTRGFTGSYGGGIFVDGQSGALGSTEARIFNCILTNNSASDSGGAIASGYGAVSLIRNCLIVGNSGGWGGGIVGRSGSGKTTLESCTIARNSTGVGSEHAAFYATNCIIYDNSGGNGTPIGTYNCCTPLLSGVGNTNGSPRFVWAGTGYGTSLAGGNFRLKSGSAALNNGVNLPWMSTAVDIAGATRIQETTVNMGAYESTMGALDAFFTGTPLTGLEPVTSVFTAVTFGTNTLGVGYRWDFNADGSWDTPWLSGNKVTNVFWSRTAYSVVLMVTNAAGETYVETNANYVLSAPATLYVSPTGSNNAPYNTWADAATNIQTAINQAANGSEIIVTNGDYQVSTAIVINKAVHLHSVNGPTNTTIRRNPSATTRVMEVSSGASDWLIDGFTIRNGYISSTTYGAGLYVHDAGVTGMVQNCIFRGNTNVSEMGGGMASGYGAVTTTRNCIFLKNRGSYSTGAYTGRGNNGRHTLENCTFVDNTDGSVYRGYDGEVGSGPNVVRNCIFDQDDATTTGTTFDHCLWSDTADKVAGVGNTNGSPLFVDKTAENFRLQSASLAFNTGTNLAWMATGADIDGNPRIKYGTADMGAYENDLGPLSGYFTPAPTAGLEPLSVVMTATFGGDTNGLGFRWDFTSDGTYDTPWDNQVTVTNVYGAGRWRVTLQMTNAVGDMMLYSNASVFTVSPHVLYVSPAGSHTAPYSNWLTAATSIQTAVNYSEDGATIIVSNGVYTLSSQVSIGKRITLRSLSGPAATILQPAGSYVRNLYISVATNYLVDGFTLRNANMPATGYNGGGILTEAGTVGTVQNCIITNNTAEKGAGICGRGFMTIRNCLIAGNSGATVYAWAGGLSGASGSGTYTVENCTFARNYSLYYATYYGGSYCGFNTHETSGSHVIRNCIFLDDAIVIDNQNPNLTVEYTRYATIDKSGYPSWTPGSGNITNDPVLITLRGWPYVPAPGVSPCINTGTNRTWMQTATDLAGNLRLAQRRADMGAYEYIPQPGTVVLLR